MVSPLDEEITEEILQSALEYHADYRGITSNIEHTCRNSLSLNKNYERLEQIKEDIQLLINSNPLILEVGSGVGSFQMVAEKSGFCCYGVEPNIKGLQTAILRDKSLNSKLCCAIGEKLPFKDESFDLIVSFQVLEHTQSPKQVLWESIRVLKPGGYLYFVIPNYNSFWEGHYGLLWLPRFPKVLAKVYIKLYGKNPKFIDTIQYITPKLISSAIKDKEIEIISYGIEKWDERLRTLEFSTWGKTEKLKRIVTICHKMKLSGLIAHLGRIFQFYYPIILILRKK